jgi:hypothetical protein
MIKSEKEFTNDIRREEVASRKKQILENHTRSYVAPERKLQTRERTSRRRRRRRRRQRMSYEEFS